VTAALEVDREARIRAAFEAAELQLSATLLLELYGPEIFRFLIAKLHDPELAGDVFGDFTEDLWRGIAGFRWVCSARAWAYTLARHAASRSIKQQRKRAKRNVPLSRAEPLSEIADRVRSQTSAQLRTETRSRLTALRGQLPEEEQMLLMLRVNRELPWLDIARILATGSLDDAMQLSPHELSTEAARLRKRFQKAKEKLRRLAAEAGLLDDELAPRNEKDFGERHKSVR
jgi:RNA polymerase sigma-70 factor, ECF subfamily